MLHPELILVGTRAVTVGTPSAEGPDIFDHQCHIAMLHIAALVDVPISPPVPPSNGQA